MDGNEIRRLREAHKMTQAQLAEVIGVGLRTVGNWETGSTVPKNRLGMLKQFFGVTDDGKDDPLRAATEVTLLTELLRRAVDRENRDAATG